MAGEQLVFGDDERSVALRHAWDRCLLTLASKISRSTFESYVRALKPLTFDGHTAVLGTQSGFARDWLQNRCRHDIEVILGHHLGGPVSVEFRVVSGEQPALALLQADDQVPAERASPNRADSEPLPSLPINPGFTFESLVVGKSNRLAVAGACSVADAPGTEYNPLFIYGGNGLGKTHLLHAIANRLRSQRPSARVALVSGESFTQHYVKSVLERNMEQFRRKYRSVDVWLVDDIQFLASRQQTKEEFFHTYNALFDTGRQIVITSDMSPRELRALDERLRQRFEQGLIADIAPPDYEMREAILRQRCAALEADFPDEVIAYIASAIQSNVRSMEGAVTRMVAHSSVFGVPLSIELAHDVLGEFFVKKPVPGMVKTHVPATAILRAVAEHTGHTVESLRGARRTSDLAQARHIAMYLCRDLGGCTLAQIGEEFGGRDHTTVQRAIRKVEAELMENSALRHMVGAIRSTLER